MHAAGVDPRSPLSWSMLRFDLGFQGRIGEPLSLAQPLGDWPATIQDIWDVRDGLDLPDFRHIPNILDIRRVCGGGGAPPRSLRAPPESEGGLRKSDAKA